MAMSRRRLLRGLGAAAAAAAVPARIEGRGRTTPRRSAPIRLSRNESPYGPSPRALAAVRDAEPAALALYPDVECETLRNALAGFHGVGAERVALGAGAASILRAVVAAYCGAARTIVAAAPANQAIVRAAASAGVRIASARLAHDWSHDLPAMRRLIHRGVGLVYVCNPHNPTGSLTRRAALDAFVRSVPAGTTIVVDESYHDYVGAARDYVSFLDRQAGGAAVIVVRSFSNAYGLAGARVGYAIADPMAAARIEEDAAPAITAAGALAAAAALDDRGHLAAVASRVADDRQEFYNQANARMLRVIDSHASFVMLNAARPAAPIVDHFARNGVSLPAPFAPLDEYIRVSLGTRTDMGEFWRVWDLMGTGHL
jgi:histidinol-phosphate aminotransferase